MAATRTTKQRGRPWKPGQSGNPRGRPQGSLHKTTIAAQALLDGEAEGLTRKAIEMALAGDTTALRLCLERLLPPRRERPVTLVLPDDAELPAMTAALLHAAARGDLTPGEAGEFAKIVEAHRKVVEAEELERRVAALEERFSKGTNHVSSDP